MLVKFTVLCNASRKKMCGLIVGPPPSDAYWQIRKRLIINYSHHQSGWSPSFFSNHEKLGRFHIVFVSSLFPACGAPQMQWTHVGGTEEERCRQCIVVGAEAPRVWAVRQLDTATFELEWFEIHRWGLVELWVGDNVNFVMLDLDQLPCLECR